MPGCEIWRGTGVRGLYRRFLGEEAASPSLTGQNRAAQGPGLHC